MPSNSNVGDRITRRDFTKITGLGGLFATASVPGFANEMTVEAFQQVDRPIDEAFTPSEWLAVGPFQYQRRDSMSDWLTPVGGEQRVATGEMPSGDEHLSSEYAAAGQAEWQEHTLDDGESSLSMDFSGAIDPSGDGEFMPLLGSGLTDNHHGWYGVGGVLFTRAYALATFEQSEAGIAVLESDASQVWVNGELYDTTPAGVVLQEGTNVVLLKATGQLGAVSASLRFRPPRAPVEITSVDRMPDLPVGEQVDLPAAVRVTNTTPEQIEEFSLSLTPESGDLIAEQEVNPDPPLGPFETRLINTRIETTRAVDSAAQEVQTSFVSPTEVPTDGLGSTVEAELVDRSETETVEIQSGTKEMQTSVVLTANTGDRTDEATTSLTVREPGEKVVTTYESEADESVQQFGYRRPANFESSEGPYEAVHYLHGATVDAESAANSIAPRDDLYVIAPEARGPVAYDHEDIGRVDDMEALAVAKERFDIDENQVYLMGHSMGGHGTWHIGMHHTDRYAAMGPQHGWPDHESYIITPFKRDRVHTHPHMWAAREISLYKNLAGPNTENAADGNIPIFVTQGGMDTSVVPLMPRSQIRMLANRGLSVEAQGADRYDGPGPDETDVAYLEVPGVGHWWDKDIGPGSDVVNHPDQFEWVRQNERDPTPSEVHFYTTNLAIENTKYWVTVLEQQQPNTPTRVRASVADGRLEIETENVVDLSIRFWALASASVSEISLVDGPTLRVSAADVVSLETVDGAQQARVGEELGGQAVVIDVESGRIKSSHDAAGKKRPGLYGPMRHVHYSPYRIVYGTQGTDQETATARALANLRSHRLAGRARAPAPVIPDTAVTDDIIDNYNLVLLGTPDSNAVLAEYNDEVPITVGDERVTVGEEQYSGHLGVQYVYPTPDAEGQLIQVSAGSSLAGLRLNHLVNWIPTQTPSPDYMVFDDQFRYQAFNACLAAGYFGTHWELDPALGTQKQTVGLR